MSEKRKTEEEEGEGKETDKKEKTTETYFLNPSVLLRHLTDNDFNIVLSIVSKDSKKTWEQQFKLEHWEVDITKDGLLFYDDDELFSETSLNSSVSVRLIAALIKTLGYSEIMENNMIEAVNKNNLVKSIYNVSVDIEKHVEELKALLGTDICSKIKWSEKIESVIRNPYDDTGYDVAGHTLVFHIAEIIEEVDILFDPIYDNFFIYDDRRSGEGEKGCNKHATEHELFKLKEFTKACYSFLQENNED